MANVLLTTACNLRCAYCFAQERLQQNGPARMMSFEDVARVIAFLTKSEHPMLRLMGGEPTLHPRFPDIVKLALDRGMRIDLLSNATWPEQYNALFERIPSSRLCFLLNVDHPSNYTAQLWNRIGRNLDVAAAHGSATLSFNVFEEQPRYEYMLDLIRTHRIRTIRLSLSLPIFGERNACLRLDTLRKMGGFIVQFAREVEAAGARAALDNAVPLCMFTYEQAGELLLKRVLDPARNAKCDPVIDIGPDLRVWCCFCLSKLWNRHLDEFENLQDLVSYYRRAFALYQGKLYPLAECESCDCREMWGCQGGCLTYTIDRHGVFSPDECATPELPAAAVLAIRPGVQLRNYDLPAPSSSLVDTESGAQLEIDAQFAPLFGLLDGARPTGEIIDRYLGMDGDGAGAGVLSEFTRRAMRDGLNKLLAGLVEQRFLTAGCEPCPGPAADPCAHVGTQPS